MSMERFSNALRLRLVFVTIFCLLLIPYSAPRLLSQEATTTQRGPSADALTEARDFSFSSDRTVVVFAEGREKTTLIGNASVVSGSTELRANYIEVYGEEFRFVNCTGGVEVLDSEQGYRLKTNSLFFDRELEIIRGRGANVMEDFNNEIVIKGEFLEHRNLEDRSEIQSGTRILGEDIIATAEFVRYQRDTEVLEFSGLPLVRWKGDEYQAARIIVDMRNDTVDLQGEVYGEINIDNEEQPPAEEAPPATDDAAPTPPADSTAPPTDSTAPAPPTDDSTAPPADDAAPTPADDTPTPADDAAATPPPTDDTAPAPPAVDAAPPTDSTAPPADDSTAPPADDDAAPTPADDAAAPTPPTDSTAPPADDDAAPTPPTDDDATPPTDSTAPAPPAADDAAPTPPDDGTAPPADDDAAPPTDRRIIVEG